MSLITFKMMCEQNQPVFTTISAMTERKTANNTSMTTPPQTLICARYSSETSLRNNIQITTGLPSVTKAVKKVPT